MYYVPNFHTVVNLDSCLVLKRFPNMEGAKPLRLQGDLLSGVLIFESTRKEPSCSARGPTVLSPTAMAQPNGFDFISPVFDKSFDKLLFSIQLYCWITAYILFDNNTHLQ